MCNNATTKRTINRGFIKVLNRRATGFDTLAKIIGKALWALPPLGGSRKILKFYSCRDVFSCILKLQAMSFN